MTGSIPRKVARLTGDLLRHPEYSRRYFRHNLFRRAMVLDLELPWFPYAAIDFLEMYLKPHMTLCEYGSGGSTLFFARRVHYVYAIEGNAEWYQRVCGRLNDKWLSNVHVKFCPFDFTNPVGFEKSTYLHSLPEEPLDVIVIDGTEEWVPVRPICFRAAEQRIQSGGIIVVDDSWRYPELRENNRAKRFQTFQSVGPGRPGVTSTDVFFY